MCGAAQANCTSPVLVSPSQTQISEAFPRFEWEPVSNASHYLVWLESRVPEGRLLLSENIQTSAAYLMPPRPLTTEKATVRIRVTAVCKDGTQAALSARFRIDADKECRLKVAPSADSENGKWRVHWVSIPSAQRYEIRLHAADDGRPLSTRESNGTSADLGQVEPGARMLAVQPICKGLRGINSWISLGGK
jgi:hypothetical protein